MKKLFGRICVLCLTLVIIVSVTGCIGLGKNRTASFTPPENYATVMQVTINPKMNLYLDSNNNILAVEYLNSDAEETYKSVESGLVGKSVNEGIKYVVTVAADNGFITEDNKEITLNITESRDTEVNAAELLELTSTTVKETLIAKNIECTITQKQESTAKNDSTDKVSTDNPNSSNEAERSDEEQKRQEEEQKRQEEEQKRLEEEKKRQEEEQKRQDAAALAADAKNPQKSLKQGTDYAHYVFKSASESPVGENTVDVYTIRFNTDQTMSFSLLSYCVTNYGDENNSTIIYNGKTYYECGGLGDGGIPYVLSSEEITVEDGKLVLTMTSDGKLCVKYAAPGYLEKDFKVGDTFERAK